MVLVFFAIFDYHNGKLEVLRVNKKYLKELGLNLSEKDQKWAGLEDTFCFDASR